MAKETGIFTLQKSEEGTAVLQYLQGKNNPYFLRGAPQKDKQQIPDKLQSGKLLLKIRKEKRNRLHRKDRKSPRIQIPPNQVVKALNNFISECSLPLSRQLGYITSSITLLFFPCRMLPAVSQCHKECHPQLLLHSIRPAPSGTLKR